ncbi:MAG: hypothetical protein P1Q69_21170, partial [Candidatus Thorarchaeota archaeon]|nr:hypothetical protein [Candidatus Thorarchaeota archaeon]
MVRLTTISNLFAGIGIAVIAGSGGFWAFLNWIALAPSETGAWKIPFYLWLGGAAILALVIVLSAITTFTELT